MIYPYYMDILYLLRAAVAEVVEEAEVVVIELDMNQSFVN